MELWEPIKGMEGHYEVSNLGRVKSLKRIKRQWNGYQFIEYEIPERIRKPRITNGYYMVNLTVDGVRHQRWIHQLVAEAFIPKEIGKTEVDHKNGRKLDNRANNLRWVTHQENIRFASNRKKSIKQKELNKLFGSNNLTEKTNPKTKILHLETGKKYPTSRIAAKELNLSDSNIRRSCRSNGYSAVKGQHFRYTI